MLRKPLLVIFDAYSLLYRAYHGVPNNLVTRKGELTNAVYGFTNMLLGVLKDQNPDYALVAVDVGRSFRHDADEQYKAHRPETPEDFQPQVKRARQVMEAMRIPVIGVEGYEADDVIGTVAEKAKAQGVDVLIVTGDTDVFQLIDDNVKVLTSGRRFSDTIIYDRDAVQERYGLGPERLIDYKALVGDKSDNVPGVRGVGDKTATELLSQFSSLEDIFAHLEEINNKRARKALDGNRETALQSRHLVTICRDVPLDFNLENCRLGQADAAALNEIFRELEFRSLLPRIEGLVNGEQLSLFGQPSIASTSAASEPAVEEAGEYVTIASAEELRELAGDLVEAGVCAIDVESDSLDPISAGLVGLSISAQEGKAYYVPLNHEEAGVNLAITDVREILGPVLSDPSICKVAHNSKFDWEILLRHGLVPSNPDFDTMIAEWVLDPASRNLGLKSMAWSRLGVEMTPITDLIGSGRKQKSMAEISVAEVTPYAGADADMTLRLKPLLEKEIREKEQWSLFNDIEMPLVPVLTDMELTGVKIDVNYLEQLSRELDERLQELVRAIQMLAGYPINVNSTQQLSDFLFEQLLLPCDGLRRTASGHYSTAAEVLEGLRGEHEVIDMILEQRQLAKLKSTYVDALPTLVNPSTGRVHTSYNQTATVTGRLSSSDPNLQNIPIRTELGRQVRRAFVAEEGNVLIGADYSQVELRILAHVSQDPMLLQAFADGQDIHATTASLTYGVPIESVTPEMRRISKTVNFAIIYGVSAYGLARQSDLNQSEAGEFINAYFRSYPKVKEYLDNMKIEVARKGYVETLLGRRRYFPELASGQKIAQSRRAEAERAAINAPIQGTAADIIKIAMIRLQKELLRQGLRSRMILQVHDELVLEGPEEEAEVVAPLVKETMEKAFDLDAPLKVDLAIDRNWFEMK